MKRLSLKKLLVTLTATLVINSMVHGADVECTKVRGWYYPSNKKAKIIAKYLGVKTCSGEKFLSKVKELGLTTNAKSRFKNKVDLKKALGM